MDKRLFDLLAGARSVVRQGHTLRILSAWELMQAQAEAESMEGTEETRALRGNACVLSRGVYRDGVPMFSSGQEVLEQWSGEKISREMEAYRAMAAQVDPDCGQEELVGQLSEALEQEPMERIRWYVLRAFGVLPSEKRAREMTEGDYLYCALQMMLDAEKEKQRMCPQCRGKSEEKRCICCGRIIDGEQGGNPQFDFGRFEEMKQGG